MASSKMLNIDHHAQRSIGPGETAARVRIQVTPDPNIAHGSAAHTDVTVPVEPTGPVRSAGPSGTTIDGTSTYFLPDTGGAAVTRQSHTPSGQLSDLPIIGRYAFDPRKVCQVAGCKRLMDLHAAGVVEVMTIAAPDTARNSGNVDPTSDSDDGLTVELLARMLRTAMIEEHQIWLIAPEDPMAHFIEMVAGPGLVHRIGHRTFGSRTNVSPWGLSPTRVSLMLLEVTPDDERHWVAVTLRTVFDGIGVRSRRLDRDLRRRGVMTDRPGLRERLGAWGHHPGQRPSTSGFGGRSRGRRQRIRNERRLRALLMAASVIDRVDVDRGEIQVL